MPADNENTLTSILRNLGEGTYGTGTNRHGAKRAELKTVVNAASPCLGTFTHRHKTFLPKVNNEYVV